ncbi:MAG TPA: MBL fold metallo-hydrolase [bacterium]|nr:MBL fold metallo-hydrolase [bacterium]
MRLLNSVPPSGVCVGPRATILASGSAGNAILIETGDRRLLVDAGLSVEALERAMARVPVPAHALDAIVLTHEHDDHARGAGPLARAADVPVFVNTGTAAATAADLTGAGVTLFRMGCPFSIGPFTLTAFPVPHDAAEPAGFTVETAGRRIVIATDLGAAGEEIDPHLADADLVILESNYDLGLLHVSPYPWFLKNRILSGRGHLSNDDAARALARTAGRRREICLVHLSEANNLAALARDTVRAALAAAGCPTDVVRAVPPNGYTDPIEIG